MIRHAVAFPAAPFPSRSTATDVPDLEGTLAAIAAAGALIADLKAQLEAATRSVAALQIDKRALEAELHALRGTDGPQRSAAAQPELSPNRSHLDDALAAITKGLGPAIVRA